MAAKRLLSAVLLVAALACDGTHAKFSRHSFPKDFIFGTGSAAYQVMLYLCSCNTFYFTLCYILLNVYEQAAACKHF